MKKIMGNLTGKFSLSILTMIVLLVGVLAGVNGITSKKAAGKHNAAGVASSKTDLAAATKAITTMPLAFEPNRGQTDSRVKFLARSAGYEVFLTGGSSAVMEFRADAKTGKADVLSMNLAGANASAPAQPMEATGGVSNYYVGNDRSKWHTGIPNYGKVLYSDVYRGIDVVYQGDNSRLRYDFHVKPGADPSAIRMAYDGAKGISLDSKGNVVVDLASGHMTGSKPYIFQEYGGKQHVVDGSYVLTAKNEVSFKVGSYDKSQALVIDPSNAYGTYVGPANNFNTNLTAISADGTGVYLGGWTLSNAFPVTNGTIYQGLQDAVVLKLPLALTGGAGTNPTYSTYLGGPNNDMVTGISVSGNSPVAVGWTQSGVNFPTVTPLEASPNNVAQHMFVVRLSSTGTIQFSTLLSGSGSEVANGVAVETAGANAGRIHIVGSTGSTNFLTAIGSPATPTAFQAAHNSTLGSTNAVYVSLNPTGSAVVYSTFFGGYGTDTGNAISVDSAGNAYIAGTTNSFGGGQVVGVAITAGGAGCISRTATVTMPAPQVAGGSTATGNVLVNAAGAAVAVVMTSGGSGYTSNAQPVTFGGGCTATGTTQILGTAVTGVPSGSTLVSPNNISVSSGATIPVIGNAVAPTSHAFAAKFNPNTGARSYSVVIGSAGNPGSLTEAEQGTAIAVDSNGNAYIGGNTTGNGPGSYLLTPSAGMYGGGVNGNVMFTSPGGGAGAVASITLTSGGNYTAAPTAVAFPTGASQVCAVNPTATLTTANNGAVFFVTSVTLTAQGQGCTSAPAITFTGGTTGTGVATATANMGTPMPGFPTVGAPVTSGFAVELVSNAALNGGLTTTNTQNGLTLGTNPPISNASFPSLVYGTLIAGDDAAFPNGNGNSGAPAGSNTTVTGIAVDALGQAYLTGATSNATIQSGGVNQVVIMRRRVNGRGFPTVPVPPAAVTAANNQFLSGYPIQSDGANPTVSPLGDILLGPIGGTVTGSGTGQVLELSSNLGCTAGWLGQPLPANATPAAIIQASAFQNADVPGLFGFQDGLAVCTPYLNDVTVSPNAGSSGGTVAGNSITVTMPAGTQALLPNGSANPAYPGSFQVVGVVPTNPGIAVTLSNTTTVYTEGTVVGAPTATAPGGGGAYLNVTTVGNTITAAFNAAVSTLDPGTYQVVITTTPTCACDNSNIPQTNILTLNITGTLLTNSSTGGGTPSSLTASMQLGIGGVNSFVGGIIDPAGNQVFNIPVIPSVPLNSPSASFIPFLVNQGTATAPLPSNSNPAFPILNSGTNSGTLTATLGAVYLNPTATSPDAALLPPGGVSCGTVVATPNVTNASSKSSAVAVTNPGLVGSGVCYVQVILPPGILAGAPAGSYSATVGLQATANLSNTTTPVTNPSGAPVTGQITFSPASFTVTVTTVAGPLIINSPWISSGVAGGIGNQYLQSPPAPSTAFFSIAPFEVPTGYAGTVNSAITGTGGGNNPSNPFNNIVLDSKNLQTTATGTYTASASAGITANAALAFTLAAFPAGGPPVPTCTTSSPGIPAGVLTFPASGALPASNATVTSTVFTVGIANPAAAGMANGFYASTITVVPNGDATRAATLPVCLEIGNNIVTAFETVNAPGAAVPPPFGGGTVVSAMVMEAGNTQYVQAIANTVGPSQLATQPVPGGPEFGAASLINVPVTLAASGSNAAFETPIAAPANQGNLFSTGPANVTIGGQTVANCSATTGSAAGACLTQVYRDSVIAPPANTATGAYPFAVNITATGTGLLAATGPGAAASFTATLPVTVTSGPAVIYTPTPTTPGVVVGVNVTAAGTGYTSAPTVTFTGGCTTEPVVFATITNPGPAGSVNSITVTSLGSGCTSPPVVTFSAPQTAGGTTATGVAVVSNGVIPESFSQVTGTQPPPSPANQVISVLATAPNTTVTPTGPFYPTGAATNWLTVAPGGICAAMPVNPTPANTCTFTLTTGGNVSLLSPGTYLAWVNFTATGVPGVQPALITAVVTLTITNLPAISSSATAAAFQWIPGQTATSPVNVVSNLGVNGLVIGSSGISATVTPSQTNGPAGWLQACAGAQTGACSGASTAAFPVTLTPTTTPITISVNVGALVGITGPVTLNGNVAISAAAGTTSNAPLNIPVTVDIIPVPSLQFVPNTGTASFTIGQSATAPTSFSTQIQVFGGSDTFTLTSNVPWLTATPTTTSANLTSVTVSTVPASIPTTPGTITGVITARGSAGETATFTVTLTVLATPSITMGALTCTPNPVTAGTASVTCTVSVGLSSTPANPTTLPALVSAAATGNCTVAPGSQSVTLSSTAQTLTFTLSPSSGTGLAPGSCGLTVALNTTGGVSPAVTASGSLSGAGLVINGSLTTTAANTNFGTYNRGTTPPAPLPISVASNPTSATVNITSSATWLAVNQPTAITPASILASIVTTDPAITGAAQGAVLTANITVSAPQSVLNCAPTQVVGTNCVTTTPFTVVINGTVTLSATPTSLTFNLPTLAAPATATETVTSLSGSTPVSVPFTATSTVVTPVGGNWLAGTGGTTNASGTASSTVTVTSSGLAQGQYAGSVAYGSGQASTTPNVGVLLNVGALAVSGGPVSFSHQFGVTTPATATLQVSAGPAAINFVAGAPVPAAGTANCNWLIVGSSSGTTPGNNGSTPDSISYSAAGLPTANATYSCTVNFSAAASYGSTAPAIPVVVTLTTSINPVFTVSPANSQTVAALLGSTTSVSAAFQVSATTSFSTPPNTVAVTVTPSSGNPFGPAGAVFTASLSSPTTPTTLTISANPTGLAVGTYQGNFTVSSPSITNPVTVTVFLVVVSSCQFTAPTGVTVTNVVPVSGTPVSQAASFTVTPGPACVAANTWTATSNSSWIQVTSGGSGTGSATGTVNINVFSNTILVPRTGTVTITPSGPNAGTPIIVDVVQPGSSAASVNRQVTALYQTILGRDPDSAGFAFWIGSGLASLGQMADSFLTSPESLGSDFTVMAAYQAALGRQPTFAEWLAAVTNVRNGSQNAASLLATLNPTLTAGQVYLNLLNRAATATEGAQSAAAAFATVFASAEFQNTGSFRTSADHTNQMYVRLGYYSILGRDPDSGGFNFWLGVINSAGSGVYFNGAATAAIRLQFMGPSTGVGAGQGLIFSPEFQSHF